MALVVVPGVLNIEHIKYLLLMVTKSRELSIKLRREIISLHRQGKGYKKNSKGSNYPKGYSR